MLTIRSKALVYISYATEIMLSMPLIVFFVFTMRFIFIKIIDIKSVISVLFR